jgi:glycosyltransferase involved in cell wall biosynthesis
MMKVTYFQNSKGACDWYRAVLPLEKATMAGFFDLKCLWPQNILFDIEYRKQAFELAMQSDVFFFQRIIGYEFMMKMMNVIKSNSSNRKIVMDQDDDVFSVSPLSNHYLDYGTKEFKIKSNGKTVFEWKDGVNIDLKANQIKLDNIKRGIELCDMVTVTGEPLVNVYRQYNDNVRILPNCVDVNEWKKRDFVRSNPDEIRIGWSGGHSHWEDLFIIRNVLKEIVKKNKNVKIVVCGYLPLGMSDDYPPDQFEYHGWTEVASHSYRMTLLDLDMAVIPLKETNFNICKSPIKWIEMGALTVPSVSSLVTPYKELIDLSSGKDNGIYIEDNNEEGWISGIQTLIDNKDLRKSIAEEANVVVENNFNVNTQFHQWVNTFSEVLTCQPHLAPH